MKIKNFINEIQKFMGEIKNFMYENQNFISETTKSMNWVDKFRYSSQTGLIGLTSLGILVKPVKQV